ncbi:hypothetical protein BGZ60DRAFT_421459 [Tricladium varicosporioides]|nr:hypothetical protein BGZ60DRAFT_421459 [Hymenoscyphus varicosporioides]
MTARAKEWAGMQKRAPITKDKAFSIQDTIKLDSGTELEIASVAIEGPRLGGSDLSDASLKDIATKLGTTNKKNGLRSIIGQDNAGRQAKVVANFDAGVNGGAGAISANDWEKIIGGSVKNLRGFDKQKIWVQVRKKGGPAIILTFGAYVVFNVI